MRFARPWPVPVVSRLHPHAKDRFAAHRPAVLALCILALLLTTGCSLVRLGYGQLDTIAGWMAHEYFDLDPAQRETFARRFERLHAWHRREQLPDYAQFLGDTRTRAQRGISAADMLWLIDGMKSRYAVIAARAAPDAADLLAGLTAAQIEHLRKEFDDMNRKFLRENRTRESVAARRQHQQRTTLKQIREWTGSLNDAQEARISTLLQQVPLTDELRHEDRLRRQREFLALLDGRSGDRAAFTQRLRDWLVNWERNRPPELARAFEESWLRRAEFYAAVDRLLTPEQRAHLLQRLQLYIDDCRQLSTQKHTVAGAD